jgi:hypothetical protein
MKQWIGRWIIAVSLIHTAYAVFFFGDIFVSLGRRGVFDTVGADPMAGAAVWFILFGAATWLLGVAVSALETGGRRVPASLGWGLLALAGAGILLMPVSGFWLVLPPAIAIVIKKAPAGAVPRGRPAPANQAR